MVLAETGIGGVTGGGEAAADLLAEHAWADTTWRNRVSQLRRWLYFCEEEDRVALPADEGDVLAYVGFLSVTGTVGPTSARQYVSAVSMYHLHHNYQSPTLTPRVRSLLDAYVRRDGRQGAEQKIRTGCDAELMWRVMEFGLTTMDVRVVGCCATVIFAFVFQCRDVTVAHVAAGDVVITVQGVRAKLTHRKGKSLRRPLLLPYAANPAWPPGRGPHNLLQRWLDMRPASDGFFNLRAGARLGTASLGAALERALFAIGVQAPDGYYYGSHSPRIGGLNELVNLQFSKEYIMRRLDWSSDGMFGVYFDTRISFTEASKFFFAHLRAIDVAP